jgi:tRNA 5-methylaminomethyl-2-thiouridine biosynthesis bifunctional protein
MLAAGFQLDNSPDQTAELTGSFNPRWDIPTGRTLTPYAVQCPARCAVVGAGIAGASVAHALALRGWDVTVFDTAHTPAGGASGLPAGLAVPHVSLDDNPRARLSRSGCSLLGQHAQHLLERGQDWNPGGVEERRADRCSLWHPQACWIKPSKLVEGWLSHAGVRFVGGHTVARLHHSSGGWQLQGPLGQDLGQFEVVVVANAMGCAALLESLPTDTPLGLDVQDKLAALQAVHGTLSFGPTPLAIASLPATPVNGNGCFIPQVPSAVGHQWFVGSTFETDATLAADGAAQHSANMRRLEKLSPMEGIDLAEVLELGPVSQWSGTRCVTHDRMPLVGPIDTGASTGLWLCIGMGSRGLSLSAVCAELLAARLGGEPLPVEFSLSRSLDVNRLRRRSTGKSPT